MEERGNGVVCHPRTPQHSLWISILSVAQEVDTLGCLRAGIWSYLGCL